MRNSKRGISSTAGVAITILVIIVLFVGFFGYFGVMSPSNFMPEKIGMQAESRDGSAGSTEPTSPPTASTEGGTSSSTDSSVASASSSTTSTTSGGSSYVQDPNRVTRDPRGVTPIVGGSDEGFDLTFFENYGISQFISTEDSVYSTFSMDVDTASYTIVRTWINQDMYPDKDSVRTEEFVNYFDQKYPNPELTFGINIEGAESEFGKPNYHLLKVGIKARELTFAQRKPANMVFLVDVSGSMDREDRLELVKTSLIKLAGNLKAKDKVALVVYGNNGRMISDLTSNKNEILNAVEELKPEGATNLNEGIAVAYEIARAGFEEDKINRIILCSDGVANVGITSATNLLEQIRTDADEGITLTMLGFGMGNYDDVFMEQLANNGDGNYYYIDSEEEADRVFKNGATSMLQVVGSDAKIQLQFNPETVDRFRLLGYENRELDTEEFTDDTVDAGEVGAGQTVTALYEVRIKDDATAEQKLADVRIRYLDTDTREITEIADEVTVGEMKNDFEDASARFRLTAAVAECAEIFRESPYAKESNLVSVLAVADGAVRSMSADDKDIEFVELVRKANSLEH